MSVKRPNDKKALPEKTAQGHRFHPVAVCLCEIHTGGFLAIAYEHIARKLGQSAASLDLATLKHDTFFGREKENLVFPIALANLVLHGIDQPNLWHGNTLTGRATYAALFEQAPKVFDYILTNPPFGGKEGKDAQKHFAFETSSTQVLFVQDILGELAPDGTCAILKTAGAANYGWVRVVRFSFGLSCSSLLIFRVNDRSPGTRKKAPARAVKGATARSPKLPSMVLRNSAVT
ncbi:N-6 DNA methylase [Desulfobotulus alkaliphilus]|uniref:site-specific DNA-methyltransferase (adenine-specific) n=1 Tax=Desulfobotulus alkaliphilus TaxID=622671 RepID=A0A562RY53_9BACT|nr:N-6 DNA methylase [Desulfobotulus alkaliphilus]